MTPALSLRSADDGVEFGPETDAGASPPNWA